MSKELDAIRAPKSGRFLRLVFIGAAVALGLIASLSWWLDAPMWRLPLAAVICVAAGEALARMVLRSARRRR
ncbi:hypothetical protein [Tranquillimonas rosea]|uniref:hypothetical protein n=1 Tax=Tranquillimonas rosea TaxID=641238 RepID=UPI003BA9444E